MRALYFFPLAFIADVNGFVFFAPYLVLVMTLAVILSEVKRRRQSAPAPVAGPIADALTVAGVH